MFELGPQRVSGPVCVHCAFRALLFLLSFLFVGEDRVESLVEGIPDGEFSDQRYAVYVLAFAFTGYGPIIPLRDG
jgi:hypothetical protein